jgi:hypothetical protein
MGRKKKNADDNDPVASRMLLSGSTVSSSASNKLEIRDFGSDDRNLTENVLKLHAEAADVRKCVLMHILVTSPMINGHPNF